MKYCMVLSVAVVGSLATSSLAQNFGARIVDGSAVLDYTANGTGSLPTIPFGNGGDVLMHFQLDGAPGAPGTSHVASGNWFYRFAGDTRERHLANAVSRNVSGNYAEWEFDKVYTGGSTLTQVPDVIAHMDYLVTDTGPDTAIYSTGLCFTNFGTQTHVIDIFYAVDIDLGTTTGGDTYLPLSVNSSGRMWTITDGSTTGLMFGRYADGAVCGPFSTIMGSMTDPFLSNYIPDPNPGGFPAGDNAAIMQRQILLPPGQRVCVETVVGIGRNGAIPDVPAPGASVLAAIAGLAAHRRKRRT